MAKPLSDLERQKAIQELDEYIASCKNRLRAILRTLNWNEEDTVKKIRPLNLPKKQIDDKDDPPLPESFHCKHSIVIDEDQLKSILKSEKVTIPEKFSDIQVNFTREQKRELYDYMIYNTGKTSEPELKVCVPHDNPSGNDMTFAEIVAKARKKDKKLKRKYRTSKPTHIEEVRNLVHLQMQALKDYFNPKSSDGANRIYRRSREKITYRDIKPTGSRNRNQSRERERTQRSRNISSDRRRISLHRNRSKSRSRSQSKRSRNREFVSQSNSKDTHDRRKSIEIPYKTKYARRPYESRKSTSKKSKKHRSRNRSKSRH